MTYPVLFLGNDPSMADEGGESIDRLRQYATLYESLHVLTYAGRGRSSSYDAASNLHIHLVRATKPLALVAIAWSAYRLMRQEGVRVLIAQDPFFFGLVAWVLARVRGGRFAVGLYGTDPKNPFFRRESLKHRLYALLARFVLRAADAIQTDGPETLDRLRQEYGPKVFFKPVLPANLSTLGTVPRTPPKDHFDILCVGRFVPQKNIPLLLDILAAVRAAAGDAVRFTMVGNGPERAWFEKEVRERNLGSICAIRGTMDRGELAALFGTHHVFLMVSRYEGFPKVFMESAAAGLPIVTTDVTGIKDLVIDGETGIVVPQGTPAGEIANRIIALSDDPAAIERLSHAIKERWGKLYGGKTILDYQRPIAEYLAPQLR